MSRRARRRPIDFAGARAKLRAAGFVAGSKRGVIEPIAPAPTEGLVPWPPCIFPINGKYCGTCAPCFRRLYGPDWWAR
ncbi:MAG TPA: hypothetical protein VNZ05_05650 [Solirubrobacteraceae bacterium]|nr:hypothetical protein [Solirubrobacteraceae bacterium]